jgi:hypothetical protein
VKILLNFPKRLLLYIIYQQLLSWADKLGCFVVFTGLQILRKQKDTNSFEYGRLPRAGIGVDQGNPGFVGEGIELHGIKLAHLSLQRFFGTHPHNRVHPCRFAPDMSECKARSASSRFAKFHARAFAGKNFSLKIQNYSNPG